MRPTVHIALASITILTTLTACESADPRTPPPLPTAPSLHVGLEPRDLVVGRVANDAECHIGQRGFPTVRTHDSHVTESASGVITLSCHGQLPPGSEPPTAVVETGLLCFLPEGRTTRDAREVFTPSGQINLTCKFKP